MAPERILDLARQIGHRWVFAIVARIDVHEEHPSGIQYERAVSVDRNPCGRPRRLVERFDERFGLPIREVRVAAKIRTRSRAGRVERKLRLRFGEPLASSREPNDTPTPERKIRRPVAGSGTDRVRTARKDSPTARQKSVSLAGQWRPRLTPAFVSAKDPAKPAHKASGGNRLVRSEPDIAERGPVSSAGVVAVGRARGRPLHQRDRDAIEAAAGAVVRQALAGAQAGRIPVGAHAADRPTPNDGRPLRTGRIEPNRRGRIQAEGVDQALDGVQVQAEVAAVRRWLPAPAVRCLNVQPPGWGCC